MGTSSKVIEPATKAKVDTSEEEEEILDTIVKPEEDDTIKTTSEELNVFTLFFFRKESLHWIRAQPRIKKVN